MKKILILLLAAALLLVTSGCTQSEPAAPPVPSVNPTPVLTTKAPSPTYLPTTTMPTPEPAKSVNDNIIVIKKDGFSPAALTVKKGDRVTWLNADSTDDMERYNPTHRIRITNVYDSQVLSSGVSWSWVFPNTGVYSYSDLIHSNLQGTVTVE